MQQALSAIDKIPSPVAAVTSGAVVTNGALAWLEGVSSYAGAVATILGVPVTFLMLVYWFLKVRKALRNQDTE